MLKTQEDLKTKIHEALKTPTMGSFATIWNGRPWVRYVMINTKDSLDMYFTTSKQSRKVSQISKDPNCHITAGGNPTDFTKPYLQIEGKAEILEDLAIKKEFWNDYLSNMFNGPEDPNYVVVHIKPNTIEYWSMGQQGPEVYTI